MRGLTISLISAMAVAGFASVTVAQQQAGVSAAVRGQVALARVSENVVGRQVESGDPIFLGDAITSGRDSGMQIMLMDETVFSIGPNSEIAIDEFVYDPATDSGKVTASVAKGVFRFITGKIAQKRPEDMTVRLPTATIGIRGTIVAGAVRAKPGSDPVVDRVFDGLKGKVPDGERANDFVVLLGPGHENNTNDRGGAFVFTPNPPQRADGETGLNAGAAPPGGFGFGQGPAGVVVSRPGNAVVGYGSGAISDIFEAPQVSTAAVGNATEAQPESGPKGSPNDSNAQETSGTEANQAGEVSGNSVAEATGDAVAQTGLTQVSDSGGEVTDPSAGQGESIFDFNDLRAFNTGSASFSGSLNMGPFSVSSSFFQVNYQDFKFQFDLNNINGGGLSSAQLGCFSACSVDYSGLSGAATFTDAQAQTRVNCDSCSLTMQFTDSETINVTLEHDGNVGSTSVGLQ